MLSIENVLPALVLGCLCGSGVMAGLLFAFSNFVMRALSQIPAAAGLHAMQRINRTLAAILAVASLAMAMYRLGQGSAQP